MSLRDRIIIPLLIFLATLFISIYIARIGVDAHHDGIMFKAALDVARGKTLFTQTYAHYGPISPLMQSLSILVFGENVLSIRLFTALFYSLTAVVLFLTWSKFIPKKLSLFSVIIFLSLMPFFTQEFYPWSSVYGLFFLALTILLFTNSITKKLLFKREYLFSMGVTSALAFHSKQPYLLLPIFVITLFIILLFLKIIKPKETVKYITSFVLGFALLSVMIFIWLLSTGAFIDYLKQTIWLGYVQGKILGIGMNLPAIIFFLIKSPFWIILPMISFLIAIQSVISRQKSQSNVLLLGVSLICLSSVLQYYPIFDYSHVFWAAIPALGLLTYFLSQFTTQKSQRNKLLYLFVLIISFFSLTKEVVHNANRGFYKITQEYTAIQNPTVFKGLLLKREDAEYYQDLSITINKYFKRHPEKHFMINISDAIYMTFTDRAKNLEPMFHNSSGSTSGVYPFRERFYDYVKKYKPLIMVPTETENDFANYARLSELPVARKSVLLQPVE